MLNLSKVYEKLIIQLGEFQKVKNYYKNSIQHAQLEVLKTNRLIKKEVIDIANMTESISTILMNLNAKIDQIEQTQ